MKWIQVKAQWKCQQIFAISETSSARSSIRRAIRTSPYGSWGTESPGRFFGTFPGKWLRPAQHVLFCDQEPPIENIHQFVQNGTRKSTLSISEGYGMGRTQTRKRSRWGNFHLSPLVSIFFEHRWVWVSWNLLIPKDASVAGNVDWWS